MLNYQVVFMCDTPSERSIGGGILLPNNYILTCCHVINIALNRDIKDVTDPTRSESTDVSVKIKAIIDGHILEDGVDRTIDAEAKLISWNLKEEYKYENDCALLKIVDDMPIFSPSKLAVNDLKYSTKGEVTIWGYPLDEPMPENVDAILKESLGNSIFQLNDHPNSDKCITHGFSGCPVYDKTNGTIIGMVVAGRESLKDNFMIDSALLSKYASVESESDTFLYHAPKLIARKNYFQLIEKAFSIQNGKSKICILQGPGGFGKTSLAESFCHYSNLEFDLMNCELSSVLPRNIEQDRVLIIDNLQENHMIVLDWISMNAMRSQRQIILTLRKHDFAKGILRTLGLIGQVNDLLVGVKGFTEQESKSFISMFCADCIEEELIKRMAKFSLGYPILLQKLVTDVLDGKINSGTELRGDYDSSPEKLFEKVVMRDKGSTTFNIAKKISQVGHFGIPPNILARILDLDEKDLRFESQALFRTGYLKEIRIPGNQAIWVIHDVLKKILINEIEMIREKSIRSKEEAKLLHQIKLEQLEYFSKIKEEVENGFYKENILMQVEGVVVGTKCMFSILFFQDNEEHILNEGRDRWGLFLLRSKDIASFLKLCSFDKLSTQQKQILVNLVPQLFTNVRCDELMGLARALSKLPSEELFANLLWSGLDSEDNWAKAVCLFSVLDHIPTSKKVEFANRVKEKVYDWIELASKVKGKEKHPGWMDLDLASGIGAMLELDMADEALQLVNNPMFQYHIQYTVLTDLVLLVWLVDRKEIDLIYNHIYKYWWRISGNPAKQLVKDYIISQIGKFPKVEFSDPENFCSTDELGGTIASIAKSEKFKDFALIKGERDYSFLELANI